MVRVLDVTEPQPEQRPPPDRTDEYEVISRDEEGDGYDISEIVDVLKGVEGGEGNAQP